MVSGKKLSYELPFQNKYDGILVFLNSTAIQKKDNTFLNLFLKLVNKSESVLIDSQHCGISKNIGKRNILTGGLPLNSGVGSFFWNKHEKYFTLFFENNLVIDTPAAVLYKDYLHFKQMTPVSLFILENFHTGFILSRWTSYVALGLSYLQLKLGYVYDWN